MTLTDDAPSRSRTKREVAAGRLLRLGDQTPGGRDEAALDRLAETAGRDRHRRRQAAGPEDADVGLGRADLELAVRRGQLPGDLEPGTSRDRSRLHAGRWTTRPAVASPIASRDGVPSRPSSAVTTPVVRTVRPTGSARTASSGSRRRGGRRGGRRRRCRGRRRAWASRSGPASASASAVGVGAAGWCRRGRRRGRRASVSVRAPASSSPARVAWMRYPAVPVPELSRCPSGPLIVATIPDARVAPSAATGPMTARTGPEPSSRVTPSTVGQLVRRADDRAADANPPAFGRLPGGAGLERRALPAGRRPDRRTRADSDDPERPLREPARDGARRR